ncbi:ABC transporter [Sinorhizobium medicae]|nr:ABC transporter [Sinorhizobium medicae]
MDEHLASRRAVVKAMLVLSGAPWVLGSTAFASSSCGDHIVRIGGRWDPPSLNPFATWSSFRPFVYTYDFLVNVDAQRHPDRKGFAEAWSVADDGLTWTFKIWPDMKWSDGEPATAKDAAFTYNFLLSSMNTPDELNVGQNSTSGMQDVKSVTALDGETLEIKTKVPTRWPIDNWCVIVPEHIWKNISHKDARTFRNDPPLVGTGPMIATEFQQGQYVRFTPNSYFRTGEPQTAGLILHFFGSADLIAQGLKSGSLDYGLNLTPAQWANLSNNPEIVVGQQRSEQRTFMAFNTASGGGAGRTRALQDPAFRDAIGYAIDQQTIVDRAMRGHADPGMGLIMPVATDYYSDLSDIRRHFDLAEAARRLDAAGYRDSDGNGIREDKEGNSFQLELITGTPSGTLEMPIAGVQLIVNWLGQIGIPVSVTQLDPGALNARMTAPAKGGGGWDLLVAGSWLSPFPSDLLAIGSSKQLGASNSAYWTNEEFDTLLTEVTMTVEQKKTRELIDQATRLIYTEAPYIMLCYPLMLEAHRKDCFEGWGTDDAISAWGQFPLDRLRSI